MNIAVIIGGGHGIGLALARDLAGRPETRVFVTYRKADKAAELLSLCQQNPDVIHAEQVDPTIEDEITAFAKAVDASDGRICWFFNAVGVLHEDEMQPEKSLKDIDVGQLAKSFAVNASVTPLLAKHFRDHFRHGDRFIFGAISARVGSIADNGMGGWYGYRASKAALNMFIKNISIEYRRLNKKSIVVALHPGTTVTELSEPFIANTKYKLHTPEQTAENLMAVVENLAPEDTGHFFAWDGKPIPW